MTTATMHHNHAFTRTPELSLSDSEDSYASSDEEMPDREETNQLLRQAHHYVITEGGKDPASLYTKRIHRINRSLIHEISRHCYDCDQKLYRRVKQKIDHVLREFEDAVDADPSIHGCEQLVPGHYSMAMGESLYRSGSSPVTPNDPSARVHTKRSSAGDVQRTYLYGDSDSHPEIWHKKAPSSLIFPETVRTAEWESLRINWDIAATGDMDNKNPVTFNDVSYNDSRLEHFNHLSQFESGSWFTLPAIDPRVETKVNDFCTIAKITEAIDAFSQNEGCTTSDGDYEYAPRAILERFEVGQQVDSSNLADDVRKAINATPIKTRRASPSASTSNVSSIAEIEADDASPLAIPPSVFVSPQPPVQTAEPFPRRYGTVSAAFRRIKAATEASTQVSALRQSSSIPNETCQSLHARRARGRPHKAPFPISSSPSASACQTTMAGKRKRLSVGVAGKETSSSTADEIVHGKRARITKEPPRPYTPVLATQPETLSTPVVTPALTMSSISASSVASTPPVTKARAEGKKQRRNRTKRDFEERVTPEKFAKIMQQRRSAHVKINESLERRITRSSRRRAM